MSMTHYMELLAVNQPWNLILFMAIPVILAETVAISELFILFKRPGASALRMINKTASIIGGIYFMGVFIYLMNTAVIPLTTSGQWRGPADVIAVGFYLAGIIPLMGMALLDLNLIGKKRDEEAKLKLHATFVAIFLVVAHVAMIFGMLDPALLMTTPSAHVMPQHSMH
ncbi:permease [Heliobacterium chlorum]|uniref:Permease n=1 Tax=Heliobacterium chlorum TaxID=2698 RepID=A0ABR7T364_HELCL|nr:DUF6803 family protein [Heliobacterium chlorum]MBC9784420.1 permease [Heliobacterium chlorum]